MGLTSRETSAGAATTTRPWIVTYFGGNSSDCTRKPTRAPTARSGALRASGRVTTTISPPGSYRYHTGTDNGPRPGSSMLRTPTWMSARKASRSSRVIGAGIRQPPLAHRAKSDRERHLVEWRRTHDHRRTTMVVVFIRTSCGAWLGEAQRR